MLDVLLLQLPVPSAPALNTPLAAGYLKAYAEAQGAGLGGEVLGLTPTNVTTLG